MHQIREKIDTMKTFNDLYEAFLQSYSSEEKFIICDDRTLSIGDLSKLTNAYMDQLSQTGVKPGSCVGYSMPNCPEILALVIAISRLGASVVPVFHMVPDMTKAGIFKSCRTSVIVTISSQLVPLKDALAKVCAENTLISIDVNTCNEKVLVQTSGSNSIPSFPVNEAIPLLFTSSSGTTGIPKAVMWTQKNAVSLIKASMAMAEPITENGRIGSSVVAFPLASAGVINLLGFMFAGVRLIFSPDPSPVTFVKMIDTHLPDSMAAPPAYYEGILALPMLSSIKTHSIKWVFTGMDFFSPLLLERLCGKFPNIEGLGNGYGLIETTNVFTLCISSKKQGVFEPTNLFSVIGGLENQIEVRDENGKQVDIGTTGELFVRGKSVINGYLGNPEETAKNFVDGWFKTGDVVRYEGAATITLLGRKKYLIKRGGKSVSPIVVQDCINKIKDVKESAVVGVPHPLYGEMVWAYISPLPGKTIQLKDVMSHCRAELVNYMVPDQVSFIDGIPKKPGVGKLDFEKMIQMAADELSRINGGTNG
jgi:acyl-CoA synthetase (AMP-forming)/AMP-acid ligase II